MDIVYTVPNQKIITVEKPNRRGPYTKINIEANTKARQILKPSTYKVYSYLCENRDGYQFALSSALAMEYCAVSINTFHAAIKEMTKYGYITKDRGNQYIFHEDVEFPYM